MRQSFYNRDKLFNFKIAKTHFESDYVEYKKGAEKFIQEQDEEDNFSSEDDSASEDQEEFPWYEIEDKNVRILISV